MKILATVSLASLALINSHAQGIIWTANRFAEHSETPGASWPIAFDHVPAPFVEPYPRQNTATRIFFMTLTTNDAGRTFFTDALTEPGFGGYVSGLTDGANGFLRFQDGGSGWGGASEQQFLGRSSLSPDLAGYNITQIGFRVSEFYDYFDPSENRNFRFLGYSLDFYGAPVPEPSTWALLILGGFSLLCFRRWRRPNHALQRTRPSRCGCNRGVPRAGSLSLSR